MNPIATVTHRNLATIDLVIIGVYFLLVFCIGFYFARKERTSTDYFLASRDIGWFFIGASLFVSNISTEHFIGLSGTGASSGLAVGHFEWLACLILLILGWVFVPFYLRSNVFTMPEFLERRFNRQCAVYLAGISIIAYIFTKISVQLYAASVVLERVAGWSLWKTAIILVIATGIYTIAGRLRPDLHRTPPRRRIGTPPHDGPRGLLPHDEAGVRSKFPVDRNLFRRAHSRHLVLVYGPGDRTARSLCAR